MATLINQHNLLSPIVFAQAKEEEDLEYAEYLQLLEIGFTEYEPRRYYETLRYQAQELQRAEDWTIVEQEQAKEEETMRLLQRAVEEEDAARRKFQEDRKIALALQKEEDTDNELGNWDRMRIEDDYPVQRIGDDKGKRKARPEVQQAPTKVCVQPGIEPQKCSICWDIIPFHTTSAMPLDRAGSSRFANIPTAFYLDCSHGFCHGCFRQFLLHGMKSSTFPLVCPVDNEFEVSPEMIPSHILTEADMQMFTMRHLEATLENKVYCPNSKCSALMQYFPERNDNVPSLECPMCHLLFCADCRVPWHDGYTCAEFQALPPRLRTREDRQFFELSQQKKWRDCPKCHKMIELTSGCNHITCICKYQFCYRCGAEWGTARGENQCSSGKCDLWDDAMLLAEEERVRVARLEQQHQQQQQPQQQQVHRVDPYRLIEYAAANPVRRKPVRYEYLMERRSAMLPEWLRFHIENMRCHYCEREFTSVRALEMHLENTSQHVVYSCCSRTFKTADDMLQHMGDKGCQP